MECLNFFSCGRFLPRPRDVAIGEFVVFGSIISSKGEIFVVHSFCIKLRAEPKINEIEIICVFLVVCF